MPPAARHAGLSLVELLITLVIAVTVLAAGSPSFRRVRANASTLAAANALVGGLHLARSQALLRGRPAVLCLSADGQRCLESPDVQRTRGWIVFINERPERRPQRDVREPLVARFDLPAGLAVHASRAAVTYWPVSRAGTTATVTFCAPRGLATGRAVIVSQSGRPRQRLLRPEASPCGTGRPADAR
jgi:type IV fimbrial biogenesis protein FimT